MVKEEVEQLEPLDPPKLPAAELARRSRDLSAALSAVFSFVEERDNALLSIEDRNTVWTTALISLNCAVLSYVGGCYEQPSVLIDFVTERSAAEAKLAVARLSGETLGSLQ